MPLSFYPIQDSSADAAVEKRHPKVGPFYYYNDEIIAPKAFQRSVNPATFKAKAFNPSTAPREHRDIWDKYMVVQYPELKESYDDNHKALPRGRVDYYAKDNKLSFFITLDKCISGKEDEIKRLYHLSSYEVDFSYGTMNYNCKNCLPLLETALKRERIVAAHAGTGKTTLAKQRPDIFVDFVSMPYKYHVPDNYTAEESESCKADPDYELNMDWPENYVEAIMSELGNSEKMLLVPPDWRLLWMLEREEIQYILCYPENTEEAKTTYRERYLSRGNTEHFLEIFIDGWDQFMVSLETNKYARHIVLKPHQFLTDIVDEICKCQGELS